MILVDSSVWINHLARGEPRLSVLLDRKAALIHPFVIGEVALGNLRNRQAVLQRLLSLPSTGIADDDDVIALIEKQALHGSGIGYIDAHLIAATVSTPGAMIWTEDRRLHAVAKRLAIAAPFRTPNLFKPTAAPARAAHA